MFNLRLANIAGLDISNAQHSVAIDESLIGIKDPEAFLEYCRDMKDSIQYATKPERLDALAVRFKKLEADADLPVETAHRFSKTLVEKVEVARVYLKNELEVGNDKPFSRLRRDGENYFTDKELSALGELGSASYLIELAETHDLLDELSKLFLNKFKQRAKYQSLADGQKRVQAMIGTIK